MEFGSIGGYPQRREARGGMKATSLLGVEMLCPDEMLAPRQTNLMNIQVVCQ